MSPTIETSSDGPIVLLPLQRSSAYGGTAHAVVVYGGRSETSSAVLVLAGRDWTVGSVVEIQPDAWRVLLLPRD